MAPIPQIESKEWAHNIQNNAISAGRAYIKTEASLFVAKIITTVAAVSLAVFTGIPIVTAIGIWAGTIAITKLIRIKVQKDDYKFFYSKSFVHENIQLTGALKYYAGCHYIAHLLRATISCGTALFPFTASGTRHFQDKIDKKMYKWTELEETKGAELALAYNIIQENGRFISFLNDVFGGISDVILNPYLMMY